MSQGTPGTATHCSDDPHVAAAIAARARGLAPCLVCMATHGRSRSAAVLGSTFTAVADTHPEPLVAVALEVQAGWHANRIVACVDGTPPSEQVLPMAAAWARRLGLRLSVVTVTGLDRPARVPEGHYRPDPSIDPEVYVQKLTQRPGLAGLDVDGLVLHDPLGPHQGLADHLREEPTAILAAVSHARTGLSRALHGSEVARIIHDSPVPVLVLPAPGP